MKWSWRPLIVSSGALAFALSALGPSRIHAQTVSTGAIAGTVTDPSGATITSVTITATEKATASKRVTQTDRAVVTISVFSYLGNTNCDLRPQGSKLSCHPQLR